MAIQALAELPACTASSWARRFFFTDEDHRYAKELKSLAVELGVADRIRFTEVRTFVFCSISPKSFGRMIVKAMFAGGPIIAAQAGGALEVTTIPA
jgi:hypothetical protein